MIYLLIVKIKKIVLLVIPFLLLLFFTSCDELEMLGSNDDDFFLSEEEAKKAAQKILFPEYEPKDTTTLVLFEEDYTVSKQVSSINAIYGGTDAALFYIINYDGGGFVLLSAEKRVNPILAYSSQNNFPFREDSYPPGLVNWLEEYAELIIDSRKLEIEPSENLSRVWDELLTIGINIDLVNMVCTDDEYVTRKILLTTEWGQGCGFNAELADSCTEPTRCNRPPVGCVATAVAQILKYHSDFGWDGNYIKDDGAIALPLDWDGMPLTGVDQNNHGDIPNLMADLGPMLRMSYSCTGSGASVNNAYNTFTDNFGFSSAALTDVNYNIALSDIQNNRPVFMVGWESNTENIEGEMKTTYTGHAWVADGYSQLYTCDDGYTDEYKIHMNWGWGGSNYDGFFVKKQGRFDEDRQIIYYIQ